MVLKVLDYDLSVYHIYSPLQALLSEQTKLYEEEIFNLAYKTFYNQFIFTYTHSTLAYNIVYYILNKSNQKLP
jgi:hypothetical protein